MPKFKITYASTPLRERLPEIIDADDYRQSGGFFIFLRGNDDPLSPTTITNHLAAKTVLHIERLD